MRVYRYDHCNSKYRLALCNIRHLNTQAIRERIDLGTDSDSTPISVDRNRIRSNIRSVIDPSAICRPPYQLLHRMPPKPHNHKRHNAVITLCYGYKVLCRGRGASRSTAHGTIDPVFSGSFVLYRRSRKIVFF